VCASPGRDRKVAEEAADTPTTVKKWKRKGKKKSLCSYFYTIKVSILQLYYFLGNDSSQPAPNSIELRQCPIPPKKAATANNAIPPPLEEDKTQPSKKKIYYITVRN